MTDFNLNWGEQIPFPSYAENNKFLPMSAIDGSIPRDGRRYAVYTYNLNPAVMNLSGSTLYADICSINVDNWDNFIDETYTDRPLSADVTVRNLPAPLNMFEASAVIAGPASIVVNFTENVQEVEIANNSESRIYFWMGTYGLSTPLSAIGMPLDGHEYYSSEGEFSAVTIMAMATGSDVRIMGRYRG